MNRKTGTRATRLFFIRLAWRGAAARFEQAMARHALALKAGYNPDQPRDDHGRWTSAGGGEGAGADAGADADASTSASQGTGEAGSAGGINDSRIISDAVPESIYFPGAQLAQNDRTSGYPVDLLEEERLGGHTIERHVGKSDNYLRRQVESETAATIRDHSFAQGLRRGSFPSLESANKLVNSTLAQNADQVDLVASGASARQRLESRFPTPTGYEAYAQTERSQTVIRQTYGVRVIVTRDPSVAKGYIVRSAFPRNLD